jgi:hypothetical protein
MILQPLENGLMEKNFRLILHVINFKAQPEQYIYSKFH